MARIRSVHPGQWTDEDFVCCSPLARLLCLALRNEADDQGVFEWKPLTLKMRLMPADNADMDLLMEELITHNQIKGFDHAGRKYGVIRNFRRYQRPKKPNSVHFMPPEFRTYVALGLDNSELDDDEGGVSSEPKRVKARAGSELKVAKARASSELDTTSTPINSSLGSVLVGETPQQREEEGGRRLEGGGRKKESVEAHNEAVLPPKNGLFSDPVPDPVPEPERRNGTRLPADWAIPEGWTGWANSNYPGVDVEIEARKFANYWQSKTGRDATKLDWQKTWQNWVINAKPTKPIPGSRSQAELDEIAPPDVYRNIR